MASLCPACGTDITSAIAAGACPRCGTRFAHRPQRTLMGGLAVPGAAPPDRMRAHPHGGTVRIPPQPDFTRTQPLATSARAHAAQPGPPSVHVQGTPDHHTQPGYDPLADPLATSATIIDVPVFDAPHGPPVPAPQAGSPPSRSGATLLGVARPGIAPLRPGVAKTPLPPEAPEADREPPPSYRPLEELGATQNVPRIRPRQAAGPIAAAKVAQELRNTHPLGKRRFDKRIDVRAERDAVRAKGKRGPRWPLLILGVALALVVGAIVLVVIWPKPAPLKAQVRTADGGADVLDLTCESCPDGTVLRVRGVDATVTGKRATLPLDAPLDVGDRTLSVFIDRPGSGRDETVALPVRVAYRIRPDLTTLDADRPSLQIIIEAMEGATVQVDGVDVNLRDHRAVKTVEVARDLSGPSMDGGAQLNRKVSFVVKPPNGPEEKGVVAVSVGIVQLSIDAPGRSIVTDRPTFVLSGHTTPGAEIVVAGRSLGVSKDGNFSQTMNVSSVGATEIEVRAKLAGRAPRLIRLAVERTTSLEGAATAFMKRGAIDYATAAKSVDEAKGKSVMIAGEVLESKVQDGITTMIVRADGPGCERVRCIARLVQGRADLGIDRGARIRAFGTVAGSIARDGETLPDVDVAFSIIDGPPVAPGAPSAPSNPPRL